MERTAHEGEPGGGRHVKGSYANSTPATDGNFVVTFFGSEGLYCFEMAGKLLWKQQLGLLDGGWSTSPDLHFGFGSSPIIYRNLAIAQCDAQNQSFIAAFDLADGREVWRMPRGEDTSWSTPTIVEGKGGAELIASGTKFYRGYDPLNGKELWRLADGVDVKIPTPIAAHGLYFLGGDNSHEKRTFYALRSGLRGEVSAVSTAQIAWQSAVIKPHIVTPIVYGDYL
ncbi:MAG: PQQ-binding-like beta-propeller repeat protein [Acidobacteriota bacterium]